MPSLKAGTGRGCRRGSQAWCSVLQIGIAPCLPAGAEASPDTRRPNGYGQSAQRSAPVHRSLAEYPDDLGGCQLSGGAITRRTTVSRARCRPAASRWANGKWRQKLPFWTQLAKDWLWSRAAALPSSSGETQFRPFAAHFWLPTFGHSFNLAMTPISAGRCLPARCRRLSQKGSNFGNDLFGASA